MRPIDAERFCPPGATSIDAGAMARQRRSEQQVGGATTTNTAERSNKTHCACVFVRSERYDVVKDSEPAARLRSRRRLSPRPLTPEGKQMAEAPLTVYEAQLRVSMISGVVTIARLRARDAVKKQLRDKGLRVSHFSAKEISILADEYFTQHEAELLNDAATTVERLRVKGYLGKRAQAVRNPPRLPAPRPQSVRNPPQIRTLAKPQSSEHGEI